MSIFNMETSKERSQIIEDLKKQIDSNLVEKRKGSYGKYLNYIKGSTAIQELNRITDNQWSFKIDDITFVDSDPYEKYDKDKKERVEVISKLCFVSGTLEIPSLGSRSQTGSHVFMGNADNQAGAVKSATTDALKKCASLFGLAVEIYSDDYDGSSTPEPTPTTTKSQTTKNKKNYKKYDKKEEKKEKKAEPKKSIWDNLTAEQKSEIKRLETIKNVMKIKNNNGLNKHVQEFLNDDGATYKAITPDNMKAFNNFLESKA